MPCRIEFERRRHAWKISLRIDEAYLRESILDPARRVMEGYEMERTGVGMPSYLGVLRDHEIESVILFIKGLNKGKK